MDIDYAALAADIQQRGWGSLSDGEIANLYNTPNAAEGTTTFKVPMRDAMSLLLRNGGWAAIKAAKDSNVVAGYIWDLAFNPHWQEIDLADPDSVAMLGQLVTGGVLTAGQRYALVALSTRDMTPGEAGGFGAVTHLDVARALRG